MDDRKDDKEERALDLGKSCHIVLDSETREVRAVCPIDVLEKAVAVQPRRIIFELLQEQKDEPQRYADETGTQ
jgi:hypothetical protein